MPQYDTESMISGTMGSTVKSFSTSEVWVIISVILAVIGGIFLFSTFFTKDKEKEYTGYKKILFDFVNFKFTIIEPIFKLLYLVVAIALTLSSLSLITTNFFKFVSVLVFGNIIVRISFELLLLTLKLFKDVSIIKESLSKKEKNIVKLLPKKEPKKSKENDLKEI